MNKRTDPVLEMEDCPVVDLIGGKFSAVSMIPYHHTNGVVMRSSGAPTLVGFCRESPGEVLEKVFPNYYVTCFNGYDFFDSGDFDSSTPMLGLGIYPIDSPKEYGIEYNGNLAGLLKVDGMFKARRGGVVERDEIDRIVASLSKDNSYSLLNLNQGYKQMRFNKQQIIDIVGKTTV
jgi:hypothetical protein